MLSIGAKLDSTVSKRIFENWSKADEKKNFVKLTVNDNSSNDGTKFGKYFTKIVNYWFNFINRKTLTP